MTQQNIPPATVAAAVRANPDWWLECAAWHEAQWSADHTDDQWAAYHSAAALACRTFALMMRRAEKETRIPASWYVSFDGEAKWDADTPDRSLPAAAVAALTEEEA